MIAQTIINIIAHTGNPPSFSLGGGAGAGTGADGTGAGAGAGDAIYYLRRESNRFIMINPPKNQSIM